MLAGERCREPGVVLDAIGAGQHVDRFRLLDRLARVLDFDRGERAVALAQIALRAMQDAAALGAGHRRPDGESRLRRRDRLLDLGFPACSTRQITSPVAGLMLSNVSPDVDAT
jgi:hypothetical protein